MATKSLIFKSLRIALLILTVVFTPLLFHLDLIAQFQPTQVQISSNQTEIKGKTFYLHEVKPGHTLYSIAKAYGVSQEIILAENPELDSKPLSSGIVIKIPVLVKEVEVPVIVADTAFLKHIIKSKENWFSISRLYGVRVSDLKTANPQYRWGLPEGDILLIPKKLITQESFIEQAKVVSENKPPATDTRLDSSLVIDTIQSHFENTLLKPVKDLVRVALILPLQVNSLDTLRLNDSIQPDLRFWEFLQGCYLAIDTLKSKGYRIDLKVFDTERSEARMERIIASGQLNQMDLIIGPVYTKVLAPAARFAKDHRIPIVSPLSSLKETLEGNPYLFQANGSPEMITNKIIEYLGNKTDQTLTIIAPYTDRSNPSLRHFADELLALRTRNNRASKMNILFYERNAKIFIDRDSMNTSLFSSLRAGLPNLVVIPTRDEAFATEMINRLKGMAEAYHISIFGSPEWSEFTNIDLQYMFEMGVQYYSDFAYPFIDYADPEVINFCHSYHQNWNSEPTRFSFQGYDITRYFVELLASRDNRRFSSRYDLNYDLGYQSLLTPFQFIQIGNGDGYENQAVQLIRYNIETLSKERFHLIRASESNRNN